MVEAEFAVQALQMKNDVWDPNWNVALGELVRRNLVSSADAESLAGGYEFLRRCETALRRWQNGKIDIIPGEQEEQRKLSKRLGYDSVEGFTSDYLAARETIHAFYEQRIRSLVS
jgi:glutamine synthetase adenylyltransferase